MMRVICLLLVSLFALKVNAQQYTKFNGYGFAADRMRSDSISIHPSDTIRNKAARSIAVLNGVFYIADGTKWKVVGTDTTALSNRINLKLNIADTSSMLSPYSKLKSVGLSMPSAFSVANSPLTSDGTLAVSGAGTAAQYVRGDGQLANFPSNGGGGSSVNYYLNGSVTASVAGYKQMSNSAIIGAGTDFTLVGNGLIAQFLTDVANPNRLLIPGGAWNFEMYFNMSSNGGNAKFYVELLKYNGTTFTSIASSSAVPEAITGGTTIDLYVTSLAVPETVLLTSDRLAVRVYIVDNSGFRTARLHTENSHLCEIITTFAGGIAALNGLTANTQYFATGTSGNDFAISSATDTHTFNLPTASATNRGALSTTDWTTFNGKLGASDTATMLTPYSRGSGTSGQVGYWNATRSLTGSSNLFWDNANGRLGIGTNAPANTLHLPSFNLTNSQARIGSLEIQSYSLNNSWFADNMFFNGSGFQHRNTGKSVLFYFFGGEGQFRSYSSATAGTVISSFNNTKLKFDELGNFGVGANILEAPNNFTGSSFRVFANGNVTINQATTDAGYKLDVNGTARVQGTTTITGSTTATGAIARGANLTPTLVAAANSDVLVGLDVNPTFTNGAFTNVSNIALRVNGAVSSTFNTSTQYGTTGAAPFSHYLELISTSSSNGYVNFRRGGSSTGTYAYQLNNGTAYLSVDAGSGETRLWANSGGYYLTFFSNGVEALRIPTTRNVLIGTTTDAGYKLDVNGTTRVQGTTLLAPTAGYSFTFQGSANALDFNASNARMRILGGNSFQFDINSNGNYGIYTASAQVRLLNINGSSSAYNIGMSDIVDTNNGNDASAILGLRSTTKGFLPPRMTTTQKNAIASPATGLMVYDTTLNKLCVFTGTVWETITSL